MNSRRKKHRQKRTRPRPRDQGGPLCQFCGADLPAWHAAFMQLGDLHGQDQNFAAVCADCVGHESGNFWKMMNAAGAKAMHDAGIETYDASVTPAERAQLLDPQETTGGGDRQRQGCTPSKPS